MPISPDDLKAAQAATNAVSGKAFGSSLQPDADGLLLSLPYPCQSRWPELQAAIQAVLPGVAVRCQTRIATHAVQRGLHPLAQVRNIVAVASGKGGVGKSTTAANLALALAAEGAKVGLLDADIYGPSQPLMMGATGRPEVVDTADGQHMIPKRCHGVAVNSMGLLVDADQAMIWRGPMATQALDQLLRLTQWGELDYLVVDMPPGTGDIQLSLSQRVPLTGAVIVTTPQDIALLDAKKGVAMFEKVQVPILGLVENMAVHVCSNCGHAEHVFGQDGGQRYAMEKGIPFLGALPLDVRIRTQADSGTPTVAAEPNSPLAQQYRQMAIALAVGIAERAKDHSAKFPKISVSSGT